MAINPGAPQQISEVVYEATSQLLESIRLVKETCPHEDAVAYSKGARLVLCHLGKILCLISSVDPVESPQPDKPIQRNPLVANIATAQQVSEAMFQVSRRLGESIDVARTAVPEDTFKEYARAVGETLTDIMYEVLIPIFATHPSIEPKDWK
jgi:hypothetical protein